MFFLPSFQRSFLLFSLCYFPMRSSLYKGYLVRPFSPAVSTPPFCFFFHTSAHQQFFLPSLFRTAPFFLFPRECSIFVSTIFPFPFSLSACPFVVAFHEGNAGPRTVFFVPFFGAPFFHLFPLVIFPLLEFIPGDVGPLPGFLASLFFSRSQHFALVDLGFEGCFQRRPDWWFFYPRFLFFSSG